MRNKVINWFQSIASGSVRDDHLYLFLHVPKCAGTAVIRSLGRMGRRRQVIVSNAPNSKTAAEQLLRQKIRDRSVDPNQLNVIMGHDVFYGMHEISSRDPFYFTFLRNPVERYISHYRFLVDCARDPSKRPHDFAVNELNSDGSMISLSEFATRRKMQNLMTQYLAAANDPNRKSGRWRPRDAGELRDLATDMLHKMKFIGLVEHMQDDLHTICRRLRVNPVRGIVNPSKATLEEVENSKLIELIKELNPLDQAIYELACEIRRDRLGFDSS